MSSNMQDPETLALRANAATGAVAVPISNHVVWTPHDCK
jgi:hypothetical protein